MKTSEFLLKAKAFIDTPEKWCQNASATDENDRFTEIHSLRACKFCSSGALQKVFHKEMVPEFDGQYIAYMRARTHLDTAAGAMGSSGFVAANDTKTHEEVMRMWDSAIESAKLFESKTLLKV